MQSFDIIQKKTYNYIDKGKYQKARLYITKNLQAHPPKANITLFCLNQLARIEIYLSNYQEALELSCNMLKRSEEFKNPIYKLATIQKKIEIYFHLGKNELALKEIKNYEIEFESISMKIMKAKIEEEQRILAEYYYSIGKLYQSNENFADALIVYQKSIVIFTDINDELGYALSLEQCGDMLNITGEFNEAINYINESLEICINYGTNIVSAWAYGHLAWVYFKKGNIRRMDENIQKALNMAKKIGNIHCLDFCFFAMSSSAYEKDELEESIDYAKRSLKLRKMRGNNIEIAHTCKWLGHVYDIIRNEKEARHFYTDAIQNAEIINIPRWQAYFTAAYAKYCDSLGNHNEAIQLLERVFDLLKKSNDIEALADYFHFSMEIALSNNNSNYGYRILEEIKQLSEKNPEHQKITIIYLFNKAQILEKSIRVKDKIHAQIIYKKLIEDYDIKSQFVSEALIRYCKLLFYELDNYYNKEIIEELNEVSDKLLHYSKENKMWQSLAISKILKAKIAIYKMDISTAQQYLTEAQSLADQKQLVALAKEISFQHDNVLNLIEKISNNPEMQKTLRNSLDIHPDSILFSMPFKNRGINAITTSNTPISLIIWSKNGINLYSYTFDETEEHLNQDFVANYLFTFDTFGKEILKSSDSIDRIKHGDFTIVIRSIKRLNIGFIFKGDSYTAMQRLNRFISFLSNNQTIFHSLEKIDEHGEIPNSTIINNIDQEILDIFAANSSDSTELGAKA